MIALPSGSGEACASLHAAPTGIAFHPCAAIHLLLWLRVSCSSPKTGLAAGACRMLSGSRATTPRVSNRLTCNTCGWQDSNLQIRLWFRTSRMLPTNQRHLITSAHRVRVAIHAAATQNYYNRFAHFSAARLIRLRPTSSNVSQLISGSVGISNSLSTASTKSELVSYRRLKV